MGFTKTIGKNSNGIGAGESGTTSSTKEEVFSHASVESGGTFVSDLAEFLSGNATAEVRMGTVTSCKWVLHDTASANGAGFRFCNREVGFLNFF